jgi:hypothetical protein
VRSALLIGVIVFGAVCGSALAETSAPEQAGGARLGIVSEDPLVVRGCGFKPGERVKLVVAVGGKASAATATRASRAGRFKVRLRTKTRPSDALVVQAVGARGSRATADILVPTGTLAPPP